MFTPSEARAGACRVVSRSTKDERRCLQQALQQVKPDTTREYTHDYDWKASSTMKKPTNGEKRIRDQLKTKRNLLFEEYSKNPMNTRLAIEIRLIDDQIVELTKHLVQQRRSGLG